MSVRYKTPHGICVIRRAHFLAKLKNSESKKRKKSKKSVSSIGDKQNFPCVPCEIKIISKSR